jgi:hypothetical protein
MWQGRRRPDGTVDPRHRQLQMGTEWSIHEGRTVQLRVSLSDLQLPATVPAQLEAHVAVTTRKGNAQRAFLVDFALPNPQTPQAPSEPPFGVDMRSVAPVVHAPDSTRFLTIPTNGELRSDTWGAGVAIPAHVDGHAPALDLVSFTARVGPLPLAP